jgi:hypothetical protein
MPGTPDILKITQLRNPAYQVPPPTPPPVTTLPAPYDVPMYILKNTVYLYLYVFKDVESPVAGPFTSATLLFDKYFASDVFVTYTISFTPSYHLPPNSKITVDFPNIVGVTSYSFLGSSNPLEVCSVSDDNYLDISTCTIAPNKITVQTGLAGIDAAHYCHYRCQKFSILWNHGSPSH